MVSLKPKGNSHFLNCILTLSVLLISTSCVTEPPGPTAEEAEKAVIEKETQALDEWSAGNPKGFAVNAADDITYFDDIAAHTRLDGIEEFKAYLASLDGMIPPHDYKMVDPKVQVYGNVAILTLRYHSTIDGEPGPPWKATSVYHFRDSAWYAVHAHWSLVKEQ